MPTLFKRPNGKWYIAWWAEGVQHRKSLRTEDRSLARTLFEDFSARHRLGLLGLPTDKHTPTLQELFDEYLPFCLAQRSPRTYRDTKLHIESFLAPYFGKLKATALTVKHIEAFIGQLKNCRNPEGDPAPYHPRTINLRLETLRKVLRRAAENKDIPGMPCPIKLLKTPRSLPKYVTPAQLKAWLACLAPMHRPRAQFAANTGITDTDIGRLLWKDYDPNLALLTFTRRKTHEPNVIPLNKAAVSILSRLRRKAVGPYVFGGVKSVKRAYGIASAASGINITPHMLRHTFATQLLSKGAPLSHVRDLLGHKDQKTTQIYARVIPDYLRATVARLNKPAQTMHKKKRRSH